MTDAVNAVRYKPSVDGGRTSLEEKRVMEAAVESTYTRTNGQKAAEAFGVVAALSLIALTTVRVATALPESPMGYWIAVVSASSAGLLMADWFSGLVHWTFDRFGTENTPFFGPNFIKAFRFHHTDPKDITLHGFLATNGSTSLATLAPLLLLNLLPIGGGHPAVIFLVVSFTVTSVFTILTNQFHKWAHTPSPPAAVVWLQQHGIILGREHHAIHHTWPHESYFCITTGWMNPLLTRIQFWGRLEGIAARLGVSMTFDTGAPNSATVIDAEPAAAE